MKIKKLEGKERYDAYKISHTDLSFEDIITHVNLDLDYSFYTIFY